MIDRNKFESLEDALRSAEDLDVIQRALSRETVIRNVMKESEESREVIAEQVDAAISMDQEELLKIAHGNPTTLREGLEQLCEKWLTDGVPDGAEYELSALLDYPFSDDQARESGEKVAAKQCSMCKRELDVPEDRDSVDCGGDCWGCIRKVEAEIEAGLEN